MREGTSVREELTLPSCVNFLKLPDYSGIEIMRSRLKTAIDEGAGAFHLVRRIADESDWADLGSRDEAMRRCDRSTGRPTTIPATTLLPTSTRSLCAFAIVRLMIGCCLRVSPPSVRLKLVQLCVSACGEFRSL